MMGNPLLQHLYDSEWHAAQLQDHAERGRFLLDDPRGGPRSWLWGVVALLGIAVIMVVFLVAYVRIY